MLIGDCRAKNARFAAVLITVLAAMLAAGTLTLIAARSAEAELPGKNGKIAFVSNRAAGAGEIYTMRPDGTGVTRITFPNGGNSDPAFSPDGAKIAFTSPSASNYEISVMNADGTGRKQLTNTPVAESEPTWSPDGTRIAFVANSFGVDGQTDLEIWVMNAKGGDRTRLTNNTFPDTQPAWSPLGNKIAFVSARTGDTDDNVYVMNANGSRQTNITPNSPTGCSSNCYQGHDDNPAWSPDGSKIAYVHGYGPPENPFAGGGVPNIWTMDPNGTNKTNISNNSSVSGVRPAYSPDGTRIVYVGAANTNRDIWIMNANGKGQKVLHANAANDISPDWQRSTTPPNAAPLVRNDSYVAKEDKRLAVRVPGVLRNDRDLDGDRLTARVVKRTKHGKLTLKANGSLVYTPRRNFNGVDSFAYKAYDGKLLSKVAKVTIRVRAVPN